MLKGNIPSNSWIRTREHADRGCINQVQQRFVVLVSPFKAGCQKTEWQTLFNNSYSPIRAREKEEKGEKLANLI